MALSCKLTQADFANLGFIVNIGLTTDTFWTFNKTVKCNNYLTMYDAENNMLFIEHSDRDTISRKIIQGVRVMDTSELIWILERLKFSLLDKT